MRFDNNIDNSAMLLIYIFCVDSRWLRLHCGHNGHYFYFNITQLHISHISLHRDFDFLISEI